jgi:hypothetical protein
MLMVAVIPTQAQNREVRAAGAFDEVAVTGKILVELIPGSSEEVEVKVSNVELEKVITEVADGKLKIRMKPGIYSDATVTVRVTYQLLRELHATAGGEYYSRAVISGDKLTISASAGGIAELETEVNAIELKAGEGSRLTISGVAPTQRALISSGGVLNAEDLDSEHVSVRVSTGGKADVYASQNLEATVSTGGKLSYTGDPAVETIKTSLGAKVEKR